MKKLRYIVEFHHRKDKIFYVDGKLIGSGDPTKGKLLYLDLSDETCFLQNMRIYGYDTRGYVTQILTIWLALVR